MAEDTPFDPQEYLRSKASQLGPSSPGVQVDPLQIQQFDPQAYIRQKKIDEYDQNEAASGGTGNELLTGVESTASHLSLGGSDLLEQQLSKVLPESIGQHFTAEAIRARRETNSLSALAGAGLGTGALLALTGGAAAPAEAALSAAGVGGLAARTAGLALEGGILGGGEAVSDWALGDPSLNASKIAAHIGFGGLLGGALGPFSKLIEASPALIKKGLGAMRGETVPVEAAAAPAVGEAVTGQLPKSLEDIQKSLKEAKEYGGMTDLTAMEQKPVVTAAAERLNPELQFPINDYQLNALSDPQLWEEYQLTHTVPGKSGDIVRNLTNVQKKELTHVVDKNINELAPGYEPTTDAFKAGQRVSEAATESIEKVRNELAPAIQAIKEGPLKDVNHLPGVLEYLTDSSKPHGDPNLANMFETGGNSVQIKPYDDVQRFGITKTTYQAVKNLIKQVEKNPDDVGQLFNLRKLLTQHVNVLEKSDAASQLTRAKAAMMDYIQDLVQKGEPNLQVRDVFKRYAQNEELSSALQKLGIETGEGFRSKAVKPDEEILNNIFRNSDTVQLVKDALPPEKFREIAADYLAILKKNSTTTGIFSGKTFSGALKNRQVPLDIAIGDTPQLSKIKDALTLIHNYEHLVNINPSGTGRTVLGALSKLSITHPGESGKAFIDLAKEKLEEFRLAHKINAQLAGEAAKANQLKTIQGVLEKVSHQVTAGAKAIFSHPKSGLALRGAALGAAFHMSDEQYDKVVDRIKSLSSNPQGLMDHLGDNTSGLYAAAPNVTQKLQQQAMMGVGFLNSKIPQAPDQLLLSPNWKPNSQDKAKFNRYYQAVNKPLDSLEQVKNGTLSSETMEALQAVHPDLLNEMRQNVLQHMNKEKAMKLSYPKKLSLSRFLGAPLDRNMMPQSIIANQATFNSAQLSQQSTPKQGRKNSLGGLK